MDNTNSSINKKTKKQTRCALGTILQRQINIYGNLQTVFDVRKRFSVEGEKKELFKRCHTIEEAEKVRKEFALRVEPFKCKHGHTSNHKISLTYSSFAKAKQRCSYRNSVTYKYYGGRGIEFRFKSFPDFLAELGERPGKEYSLDRIDNDGHYEKGNVRWATRKQQFQNSRSNKNYEKNRSIHSALQPFSSEQLLAEIERRQTFPQR